MANLIISYFGGSNNIFPTVDIHIFIFNSLHKVLEYHFGRFQIIKKNYIKHCECVVGVISFNILLPFKALLNLIDNSFCATIIFNNLVNTVNLITITLFSICLVFVRMETIDYWLLIPRPVKTFSGDSVKRTVSN